MTKANRGAAVVNKGVFRDEAEALDEVVRRLVETFDPESVWLFGSRAEGRARPDSDFDLLLVAKPRGSFGSQDYERVIAPLIGLGVGCDVVPCSRDDFEEGTRIKTSLIAQVLSSGRRLYDATAH
ncbi:MAG: nucleotidyltransferase domain-containing protein [Roseiarcus sp.]